MVAKPLSLATYLAPSLRPLYEAVGDYIARTLGTPVRLVTGSSFDQFAIGEVDVGFI